MKFFHNLFFAFPKVVATQQVQSCTFRVLRIKSAAVIFYSSVLLCELPEEAIVGL